MKRKFGVALLLAVIGTSVFAHSDKESVTPADGAVLDLSLIHI